MDSKEDPTPPDLRTLAGGGFTDFLETYLIKTSCRYNNSNSETTLIGPLKIPR